MSQIPLDVTLIFTKAGRPRICLEKSNYAVDTWNLFGCRLNVEYVIRIANTIQHRRTQIRDVGCVASGAFWGCSVLQWPHYVKYFCPLSLLQVYSKIQNHRRNQSAIDMCTISCAFHRGLENRSINSIYRND